jgi:hypothetical protein
MRFAPAAALAYDWMHDAPVSTRALRAGTNGSGVGRLVPDQGYLRMSRRQLSRRLRVRPSDDRDRAQGGEAGGFGDTLWGHAIDLHTGSPPRPAGGVLQGEVLAGGLAARPSVISTRSAPRARRQGRRLPAFRAWAPA